VFSAPLKKRNPLQARELLIGDDNIDRIASEEKLGFFGAFRDMEFIVGRKQTASKLGESLFIVHK